MENKRNKIKITTKSFDVIKGDMKFMIKFKSSMKIVKKKTHTPK